MQIHIIAIGDRMPGWVEAGYTEYARRMPRECRLLLHEIRASRRTKGADLHRLIEQEGARQWGAIPAGARVVALDRTGKTLDTEKLANELKKRLAVGGDMALLVGGPEGLAPDCLERAHERWALSPMTLAHPVVRVVLAEQLYRAWSIIRNLPYHR
ncbi:MAG: 23S rRNA (pseudouridine(1915)-N(3))-methyltransferase RlmH [Gammaproteobacteria bacterium]|nr:23S rRNA (pseudouridine(1915)-N(3))-methyltransferase RlmH [Gammaproteobacteria bacterium]MDH3370568.1 23S rRNA (pseudouridine(1915)-N(3))-methyltransferase RlmH [Gammaproteobacteria bacterium]MDH3406661.1 23S rRNA (pseudouridine(1915)-N(3))-methyltransferase RlmH [Gammaproteobacteria bacterium]MDH3562968.1 23S rRNA (pseudouridine(1915)-N(3))-methyltransferase RlmH [Gammaproteobacteria bacterium]